MESGKLFLCTVGMDYPLPIPPSFFDSVLKSILYYSNLCGTFGFSKNVYKDKREVEADYQVVVFFNLAMTGAIMFSGCPSICSSIPVILT